MIRRPRPGHRIYAVGGDLEDAAARANDLAHQVKAGLIPVTEALRSPHATAQQLKVWLRDGGPGEEKYQDVGPLAIRLAALHENPLLPLLLLERVEGDFVYTLRWAEETVAVYQAEKVASHVTPRHFVSVLADWVAPYAEELEPSYQNPVYGQVVRFLKEEAPSRERFAYFTDEFNTIYSFHKHKESLLRRGEKSSALTRAQAVREALRYLLDFWDYHQQSPTAAGDANRPSWAPLSKAAEVFAGWKFGFANSPELLHAAALALHQIMDLLQAEEVGGIEDATNSAEALAQKLEDGSISVLDALASPDATADQLANWLDDDNNAEEGVTPSSRLAALKRNPVLPLLFLENPDETFLDAFYWAEFRDARAALIRNLEVSRALFAISVALRYLQPYLIQLPEEYQALRHLTHQVVDWVRSPGAYKDSRMSDPLGATHQVSTITKQLRTRRGRGSEPYGPLVLAQAISEALDELFLFWSEYVPAPNDKTTPQCKIMMFDGAARVYATYTERTSADLGWRFWRSVVIALDDLRQQLERPVSWPPRST